MEILTHEQVIRAWKDEEYRNSLTPVQLAALPAAPSQIDELTDEELEAVAGGASGCTCTNTSCTQTVIEEEDEVC